MPRSLSRGLGFGVYTHEEEGFLCTRESHIFWGKKERKKSTLNPSLSRALRCKMASTRTTTTTRSSDDDDEKQRKRDFVRFSPGLAVSSVPTVVRSELLRPSSSSSSSSLNDGETPPKYLLNAPALRCRFTTTGDYAVLCKDRSVVLCNPRTKLTLKEYAGVHAREVRDATASRDNSRLVSCGGDRGVFVWDVKTGQTIRRFAGHDAFGVNCVKFLCGHANNNEESVVVSCGFDRNVKFWDLRSNRQHEAMETVGQFSDAAMDLTVSSGDKGGVKTNEISACSIDGTMRTFDIRKGELRVDTLLGKQPITAIENSGDEKCVLATLPKTIALLDKTTGEVLQTFSGINNDQNVVLRATLTPDDRYVVIGDAIGDICVWDLVSNETPNSHPLRIPGAHAKSISNVCFSPVSSSSDACGMLSCAADGLAKFWSR